MVELTQQHEAERARAVVRQRDLEHLAAACRLRSQDRIVVRQLVANGFTARCQRRDAVNRDRGAAEGQAAPKIVLHKAGFCVRGVAVITRVRTPLDVEGAGDGRFIVVVIGVGNIGIAGLQIVRTRSQPVLVDGGDRGQLDVVDIGAKRILLAIRPRRAERQHRAGARGGQCQRDLLPARAGARIDAVHHLAIPQHFKPAAARSRVRTRCVVERQFVVLPFFGLHRLLDGGVRG